MLASSGVALDQLGDLRDRTNCEIQDCEQIDRSTGNTRSLLIVAAILLAKEIVFIVVRFINFNFVNAFIVVIFLVVS
jgi:hypothetical protein